MGLPSMVLHIVGEEGGDVFIGTPVQGHAERVAVLGLELVLQVLAIEEVGTEPVQVCELLVGQLVELAIRRGGEAGADEVLQVQPWIGVGLARTGHVVGQVHDLAVAVVRADQVGVGHPAVVDRLARLHRGLQLLHHIAFLDQVMLDLDAGDLLEGLGQRLGFIVVRGDGLGDHRDLLDALGLQGLGGIDEPFHLRGLLVLVQGRGLELGIDPFLRGGVVGPRTLAQGQGGGGSSHGMQAKFHHVS